MLQLLLLRHAKSSWDDPGLADADRPLSKRGICAAAEIGQHMLKQALTPSLAPCSPALRARETWALVVRELNQQPPTRFVDDIYDFGTGEGLLEAIRREGGAEPRLLVIGHNPSLEGLAISLCDRDSGKLRTRMEKKYPTATLAIFDANLTDWSQLAPGTGRAKDFVRPRDIE